MSKPREFSSSDAPINSGNVLSSQIKLVADKANRTVKITLPCGQTRSMSVDEFRLLSKRCNEVVLWVDHGERLKFF